MHNPAVRCTIAKRETTALKYKRKAQRCRETLHKIAMQGNPAQNSGAGWKNVSEIILFGCCNTGRPEKRGCR